MKTDNRPWYWIPFLNFASGLPYAIYISVSVIIMQNLGLTMKTSGYTRVYCTSWVIKPESIYRLVPKKVVLAMQLVISIAFLLVGLTIPMNNFFVISLAFFGSRLCIRNDVASDGFYMLALEKEQQSFPRNTQYLLSPFHAYRKWFDCNNRWLSGTGIWR
jgi:PAT family beta-lactamase induction signal transducer AmpG